MKRSPQILIFILLALSVSVLVFLQSRPLKGEAAPEPIVVSSETLEAAAVKKEAPERSIYDEGTNMSGVVHGEVIVGESGYPYDVKAVAGPEELRDEAVTAAWQWHFDAKRLSAKPRKVKGELVFDFPSVRRQE